MPTQLPLRGLLKMFVNLAGYGKVVVDIGDPIANSLMLDSSASQYISRVFTTAATWTMSICVKRGKLSTLMSLLDSHIKFNANDTMTAEALTTIAVERDPTSWFFVHVSNNGLYVSQAGGMVLLGAVTTTAITNPRLGFDGTNYGDLYVAEFYFFNNQTIAVSNFTRTSTDTGQVVYKKYSGSYLASDSYLNFQNSGALGTDASGNGNNWTLNGGITSANQYDESPTNNYCVLNPLLPALPGGFGVSKGNTVFQSNTTNSGSYVGTIPVVSGKYYWECTATSVGAGSCGVGVALATMPSNVGYGVGTALYDSNSGHKYLDGSDIGAFGATWITGAVIGVAYDASTGTLEFFKNNISQGTWTPAGYAGNLVVPCISDSSSLAFTVGFNSGSRPFTYTPPTGFKALCTANLLSEVVTVSGTFTGNVSADGPFVFCNGYPTTLTINGNLVTWGTHADKTAGGFKLRTASASYNASGSNTWTATIVSNRKNCLKYANAQGNP